MNPSTYRFLADGLVVFHFAFVAFVMTGGLLVLRWPRLMTLHLPAVAWGIFIELSHGLCPLTPMENHLRLQAGQAGYAGGFVDHYIMPVLYPEGLTEQMQVMLACLIVMINVACYTGVFFRIRKRRRARQAAPLTSPTPTPSITPSDPPLTRSLATGEHTEPLPPAQPVGETCPQPLDSAASV